MTGGDALHLEILTGVTGQLQHLQSVMARNNESRYRGSEEGEIEIIHKRKRIYISVRSPHVFSPLAY